MNRFVRDTSGASLVEFLLILPLLILLTFAVVDMGLLMWQWNQAAKATQMGARIAVVNPPVAIGVNVYGNPNDTDLDDVAYVGQNCTNPDGTMRTYINSSGETRQLCNNAPSVCSSTACTNGYAHNAAAFDAIFNGTLAPNRRPGMADVLPLLEPENVRIVYSGVGLGFVGRPTGSPVAVTVSLRCFGMPLIFLDTFFDAPEGCDGFTGAPIPAFATTLVGEGMY